MARFTQADLNSIYDRRQTPAPVRPFINAIFGQESSGGRARTDSAGVDGAIGPMQVIEPTFNDLRSRGRIPNDYVWSNPLHSAEAGVAYGEDMMSRYNNNPAQAAAAYFGGPGAIDKNGAIFTGRADSNGKTIGSYVNDVLARMRLGMNSPDGDATAAGAAKPNSTRGPAYNSSSQPAPSYEWGETQPLVDYSNIDHSSATGAAARGAIGSALPAAGGFAAGVASGAALGSVVGPVGTIVGGLIGGLATGAALSYGQEKLFEEYPELAKALGQDKRQRFIDAYEHPTANFVGSLVPNAAFLRPSTLPFRSVGGALARAEAASLAGDTAAADRALNLAAQIKQARVGAAIGGGLMGGMELGQQMYSGEPVDLTKVGLSTAFGTIFNKEWGAGRSISEGIHARFDGSNSNGFQGGARTMSDEAYAPDAPPANDGSGLSQRNAVQQQGDLFPFRPGLDASEQYAPVPSNIPGNLPESAWPKWYADQVAAQRARQAPAPTGGEQLEIPGFERPNQNQLDLFDNPTAPSEVPSALPQQGQQLDMFGGDPARLQGRAPQQLTWDGSIKLGTDQPAPVDPNAPPNYDAQRGGVRPQPLLTYEPTSNSAQNLRGEGGNTLLPSLPAGENGQMRMRLPTPEQPDIPENRGGGLPVEEAPPSAGTGDADKQMDMFNENPSATVITDFSIPNIVKHLRAMVGGRKGLRVTADLLKSARELSKVLGSHNSKQLEEYVARLTAEEEALKTKAITPETIAQRQAMINAKRDVIDLYLNRMADAQTQERTTTTNRMVETAKSRARPGVAIDERPAESNATEMAMREKNAQQAAAEAKQAAVESSVKRQQAIREDVSRMEAERRDRILQDVIAESTPDNVEANFAEALRTRVRTSDRRPTAAEQAKIDRFKGTVEAYKNDSGRQESLFTNQEAPVVEPPEGTPASALRGKEPPVETQDDGPDYLNRELFSVPTDGSRAVPTRQAMGTTREQQGISKRQLIAEANAALESVRGSKSKAILQRAVNQFMNGNADIGLVRDVASALRGNKHAAAEKMVAAAEPKPKPKKEPTAAAKPAPAAAKPATPPPTATKPVPAAAVKPAVPPAGEPPSLGRGQKLDLIRDTLPKLINRRLITPEQAASIRNRVNTRSPSDAAIDSAFDEIMGYARKEQLRQQAAAPKAPEKPAASKPAEKPKAPEAQKKSPEPTESTVDEQAEIDDYLKRNPTRRSYEPTAADRATDEQLENEYGPNYGTRLRRGEGEGQSIEDVQRTVDEATANWKRKPNIKVVQSLKDAPPEFHDMPSDTKGFYGKDGSLYIVADQAASAADVRSTIFHETLGHYGLRGKFNKELGSILKNIYETNSEVRAAADRWLAKQMGDAEGAKFYGSFNEAQRLRIATEEVLASRSEAGPQRMKLWNKVVAVVRDFARRLGMDLEMTNNDVKYILAQAHEYAMGENYKGFAETRLSRNANGVPTKEAIGKCFSYAYKLAVSKPGATLVHADVTRPMSDVAYPHAWVEIGDKVYDWQTMVLGMSKFANKGWPKEQFYEAYNPENIREYSGEEARKIGVRNKHYGPWDTSEDPSQLLDDSKYFYHSVRNDSDIASIVKNGLRAGTNVSRTSGQAFDDEGGTILVFKRGDAKLGRKDYQGDLLVQEGEPKPVAILKDTSVEEHAKTQDQEFDELGDQYEKLQEQKKAALDELGVSEEEFDRINERERIRGLNNIVRRWGAAGETLKNIADEERALVFRSERIDSRKNKGIVTTEDVLSRYDEHGLPVHKLKAEYDEDTDKLNLSIEPRSSNTPGPLIDNARGVGAVPNNEEVDYLGFKRSMRPSEFLRNAAYKDMSDASSVSKVDYIRSQMQGGRGVGSPFLNVEWNSKSKQWDVIDHDGRHRMEAIRQEYGDVPVEVHMFPRSMRAKDITPEMRDAELVGQEAVKDRKLQERIKKFDDELDVSGARRRQRLEQELSTPKGAADAATTMLRRAISDEAYDFIQEHMPEQAKGPLQRIISNLLYTTKKGVTAWAFTPEIAENAYKSGVKSSRDYVRHMLEREKLKKDKQIEVESILNKFDALPEKVKGLGKGTVNDLLRRSTVSSKWAFKPEYHPDLPDSLYDPALAKEFDQLPAEAQQVIKDVFKYGHDTLRQMKSGVLETVANEYMSRLETLAPPLRKVFDESYAKYRKAGDDDAILSAMTDVRKAAKGTEFADEMDSIQSSLRADTAKYYRMMGLSEYLPYAPIRRFGNYVVVGRSNYYMEQEKQLGGLVKQSELDELKSKPEHYFVDFANTYGEAQGMANALEKRFGKGNTTYFEKEKGYAALGGNKDMFMAFQRLQRLMTQHFDNLPDSRGLGEARKLIGDLYINTLIDSSARKSELKRLNVAGNDIDMMRSFASKGLADAHFVGNLFKNADVLDSLGAMRKEVKAGGNAGRAERQMYVNELLMRHAMNMGTANSKVTDVINRATSMWMLAMSPSYYLQNMSQPFMMSLPYMAGRHGYGESAELFMQAYKDLAPMLKAAKAAEPLDMTKNVPADVEPVLKELILRGLIDIGIDTDLGTWASQGNGKLTKHWNAVDRGLRNLVQKTETINRLSTGMAAYRAEFTKLTTENKGMSIEARQNVALEYAADVIRTTHGNYDAFSAPRAFNTPTGKVLLQFRKFQLIQLGMMSKMLKNSFGEGPEALIARKALGFTVSHAVAMGGAMGLPGMAALAWLYGKLAGDENDPADLEEDMRKAIGDPDLAQVLVRGAPNLVGLDMSSRMGMGTLLSVAPYTDVDKVDRDTYKDVVVSLLGPAIGGLGVRGADAFNYMAQGDYYKGLETLLPVGLPQGMAKAYRIGNEGVTQKNSDVLIQPQDVADVSKFYTAVGLPSSQLSNQQWARHRQMQVDEFFKGRTTDIKRAYTNAKKQGDTEAAKQAMEDWKTLQESRKKFGLKVQPMQELLGAYRDKLRNERNTVGGLAYTSGNRGYATDLAELTGAEGY